MPVSSPRSWSCRPGSIVFPLQGAPSALAPRTLARTLLDEDGLAPASAVRLLGPDDPAGDAACWQGTLAALAVGAAGEAGERAAVAGLLQVQAKQLEKQEENAPLSGKRVLVTRTLEEGRQTALVMCRLGAEAVVLPCLEIRLLEERDAEGRPLHEALRQAVGRYDDLVVTSPNGARALGQALRQLGLVPEQALTGLRIVSIGPRTTAELQRQGLRVDLTAAEHRGQGVARELLALGGGAAGSRRVLLPRAVEALDELPRALAVAGWLVDDLPAYRTVQPALALEPLASWLTAVGVDVALFASPSAFHNCRALLGEQRAADLLGRAALFALGPTTAAAIEGTGLTVAAVPRKHTMDALLESLTEQMRAPLPGSRKEQPCSTPSTGPAVCGAPRTSGG